MIKRIKKFLLERKKLREIRKIVKEIMLSVADQREHIELNKKLRGWEEEK